MSAPADASARLTAIFAKRPQPGTVKTRLCPPLEPGGAAALAEAMLDDLVASCRAAGAFRTALRFAPAEAGEWAGARYPELADRAPQRGAGLAVRLAAFFEDELGGGRAATAVVVGSDAPLVGAERIEAAHAALETGADLVLAPDAGGGYALVGLREPHPELFLEVPMSTEGMCARTVELARARGLEVALLEGAFDVDVAADLERLRVEIDTLDPAAPGFPQHTARVLASQGAPAEERRG